MSATERHDLLPAAWVPDPEHERLHTPVGDESLPWSETWYLSLHDVESEQTLGMHMTITANRTPPTRVGVTVASGQHATTEVLRNAGDNGPDRVGNELAHLELVHLSADSSHELRWVGDLPEVSFDVTVKGRHFASYWDTMFPGYYPTGKHGHQYSHFEQGITGEGWVQWRGQEKVPFDGSGWRDRGWGRRGTDTTFLLGFDLASGILPDDSVFSLIALRSGEVAKDAPMPIAGWRATADSLQPIVAGTFHKDSMAWPSHLELEFLDGYRLDTSIIRRSTSIADAWHEADVHGSGVAVNMRDYYAVFGDGEGRPYTLFSNHGYVHKVDVTRDARFLFVQPPSVP